MTLQVETLLAIAAAAASTLAAVASLAWWLATKFSETRKTFYEVLEEHEKLDQARHEQNLERFARISVALAQLGHRNGP